MNANNRQRKSVVWLSGHIIAVAALFISGCAAQQPTGEAVWRDLWATKGDPTTLRSGAQLKQDGAQCDYEKAQAQAALPAPGPNPYVAQTQVGQSISNLGHAAFSGPDLSQLYEKCMMARGWEFVGYE